MNTKKCTCWDEPGDLNCPVCTELHTLRATVATQAERIAVFKRGTELLSADLAAAYADVRRLDWMERNCVSFPTDGKHTHKFEAPHQTTADRDKPTIRSAIDAALTPSTQPPTT